MSTTSRPELFLGTRFFDPDSRDLLPERVRKRRSASPNAALIPAELGTPSTATRRDSADLLSKEALAVYQHALKQGALLCEEVIEGTVVRITENAMVVLLDAVGGTVAQEFPRSDFYQSIPPAEYTRVRVIAHLVTAPDLDVEDLQSYDAAMSHLEQDPEIDYTSMRIEAESMAPHRLP